MLGLFLVLFFLQLSNTDLVHNVRTRPRQYYLNRKAIIVHILRITYIILAAVAKYVYFIATSRFFILAIGR